MAQLMLTAKCQPLAQFPQYCSVLREAGCSGAAVGDGAVGVQGIRDGITNAVSLRVCEGSSAAGRAEIARAMHVLPGENQFNRIMVVRCWVVSAGIEGELPEPRVARRGGSEVVKKFSIPRG